MNGTLTRQPVPGTRVPLVDPKLAGGRAQAGSYRVRAAGQEDAAGIREFVCRLSVRTQYFRFFTAVSPPSPGLLRTLAGATDRADILVVTDDRGAVVGHAMAVDARPDGVLVSDIGLVIADRWQGQGLGTRLLAMLADRAAARGVTALVLDVLPDNTRMLGIIDRRWPGAARKRNADSVTVTANIQAAARVAPDRPAA